VGVTDLGVTWYLDRLPAGAEVECTARHRFARRGRVAGGPLIWSSYPFGFLRFEHTAEVADPVTILPQVGTVDPDGLRRWLVRQAGGEDRERKVQRRLTSDQADVRGVRPYRPGDSIRTIHWRSSARRGELMVREYDAAPAPALVVVVDPYLPPAPPPAHRDALEAALSLAATLVRACCGSAEVGVTVVVAGTDDAVLRGSPTELFAREALAPLGAVQGSPEFPPIAPAVFGRALHRAARLVVSSRPNSPLAAALTHTTGKLFAVLDPASPPPWYHPPDGEIGPTSTGQGMKT
jgi:uncharacterized protein (DUF58 family)